MNFKSKKPRKYSEEIVNFVEYTYILMLNFKILVCFLCHHNKSRRTPQNFLKCCLKNWGGGGNKRHVIVPMSKYGGGVHPSIPA